MKNRNQLLIVLMLASLLATLFINDTILRSDTKGSKNSFLSASRHALEYIVLDNPDGAFPLIFLKDDNRWFLTLDNVARYPLNETRFASFLAELDKDRRFKPTDVTDHLLHGTGEHALFMLETGFDNGSKNTVFFGNTNMDERYRYFSLDSVVLRTDNGIGRYLDNRTASWVDLTPFKGLFDKTSLQRAVLVRDNTTHQLLDNIALTGLQSTLRAVYCIDITNIPHEPETTLILELGNLSSINLEFTHFNDEYAIMTESVYNVSWIIPQQTFTILAGYFLR